MVDLIAPNAPDLQQAGQFVRAAGGAPANVSVAVVRLGGQSALISAVGNDPFGTYLRELLDGYGVDTRALRTVDARTTLAFVARNTGGIPEFVFYRGSDRLLSPEDIPRDPIAEATFVHLSSMALLTEPSQSATLHAATLARASGTLIAVDPNLRPGSWPSPTEARERIRHLLDTADIVKVNDEEARILTGDTNLEDAIRLIGRPDALAVITLGPEGCIWRHGDRTGRVRSPSVTVADTTGAGDAFVGALLVDLSSQGVTAETFQSLDEAELVHSLRVACAAGALACTSAGAMAALPTRADVEGVLAEV